MAKVGLEPPAATPVPTDRLRNPGPGGAAESGAVAGDPELARVVEAWPKLSGHVKRAILALLATEDRASG
jgi:hypothetical protein